MSVNQNPPALHRPCLSGPPLSRDTDHFLSSHTSLFQSRGWCPHSSRAPGLHQVTSWGPVDQPSCAGPVTTRCPGARAGAPGAG